MEPLDMKILFALLTLGLGVFLMGCTTKHPPLPAASDVDLERFMGPWFPIGYTPILVDKAAHNAVEHYYLDGSGKVLTTYQFRDGGFEGKLKTYQPTGFVTGGTENARWKMQFFWPIKADYIIMYLSDDYTQTIIAHPNRKYAWIMQRSPEVDDARYAELLEKLAAAGYNTSIMKRLPHDWSLDQERWETIEKTGATRPLEPR